MPSLRLVNPPHVAEHQRSSRARSPPAVTVNAGRSTKPFKHLRIDVSAESPPGSARLWRNFSTMRLNRGRQQPDISSRVTTATDPSNWPASTLRVPSSRCRIGRAYAVADENGEKQSDDGSEPGHDRRNEDGLALFCPWSPNASRRTLRHHVGPDGFNGVAEFVAQRVDPRQAASHPPR